MRRALEGWRVVVTRAEEEDGPLSRALAEEGAQVILLPTVETRPPEDASALEAALERLSEYDWVVLTSGRAVEVLRERGVAWAGRPRLAVVGASTASKARTAGLEVELEGEGSGAEALARALVERGIGRGSRVFFPTSDRGRTELEEILSAAGASVDRVTAYETRLRGFDPRAVEGLERADVVTFTSPSAVEGWRAVLGGKVTPLPDDVRYVVIGETTEAAAAAAGIDAVVAVDPSLGGIVETIRTLTSGAGPRRHTPATDQEIP